MVHMGHLDLTFNGMQILKDGRIIHEVFGVFVLMGCHVMCAYDYVKDVEVLLTIGTY